MSSIRSFCTSIGLILGLAFGVGIVAIGISMLGGAQYLPPKGEPTIQPDANGNRTLLSGDTAAILRLDFHGVIGMSNLTSEKVESLLLDSRDDFLKGDRVKAIFLHMDTPGGAAVDADAIYRALMAYKAKYKIPIYAFVDGLCASGGMYIASAADKIYATPSSVIGSVGVIMGPNFNFSEAMTRYGITALTLTEGKDKDSLNPFRAWKPDEDANLKAVMASLYDRFVSIVVAARPRMTKEALINDYGAHVFIAQQAEENGYIDVAGSDYSAALDALAQAAGVAEKYQVVQLTPQVSLSDYLAKSSLRQKLLQWVGLSGPDKAELSGKFLYLYEP